MSDYKTRNQSDTKAEYLTSGDTLSADEERFVMALAISRSVTAAYREVWADQLRHVSPVNVYARAVSLARMPRIQCRLAEVRAELERQTLVRICDLLQDWHDIATCDPNEIVRYERHACRHCHGASHGYQWRDEAEYDTACRLAVAANEPLPDGSGGMGYSEQLAPSIDCPRCSGEGTGRVMVSDTRYLSPQARKLYKGLKQHKDGTVEVLLHDQETARQSLARALGAFAERRADPGDGGLAEAMRVLASRLP